MKSMTEMRMKTCMRRRGFLKICHVYLRKE
jgi:hypothetical protein